MTSATFIVETGYVSAALSLPCDLALPMSTAAGALPGGWRLTCAPSQSANAVEVVVGEPGVRVLADTVRVSLPTAASTTDTLVYAVYTALERARQRARRATVHASALVGRDGRALVLLGSKGSGKTSTAFALAERGWTHAGDDLVILGHDLSGRLTVWPGKPTAAIRDLARPLAPKPQRILAPFMREPAQIGWIVRLATHPGLPCAMTPATPLTANERLRWHEGLARYISGLPTPLTGVGTAPFGPVWPLDSPPCARWRCDLIGDLEDARFDYLHAPDPCAAAELLDREAG